MNQTLQVVAVVSLAIGVLAMLWIAADVWRHPQKMKIMNVVWPISGLYGGVLALWAYYTFGRMPAPKGAKYKQPMWQSVSKGALHCGAGCSLGDFVAESLIVVFPFTLFGHEIFAAWALDFIFAFGFGIAFQYFALRPMRDEPRTAVLKDAVKADTLSLTAWQVGMYGWMAIAIFLIFGHDLAKTSPVFWFMMQIAMGAGFAIAWPVNAWLIEKGVKEKM